MKVSFSDTIISVYNKLNAERRKSDALPIITAPEKVVPTPEEDDDDLWDPDQSSAKKPRVYWTTSVIPILIICLLIVLVLVVPLPEMGGRFPIERNLRAEPNECLSSCNIQLVESIPEGLTYPDCSPKFMSTFDAWNRLFDLATDSINIGSFYWTLRGADFYNHSSAWQGEKIFERFLATGTQRKVNIRIAQSAPSKSSPNIDTEIFVKEKAAKVRSVDFERLLGGGVLHTKLWIVDQQHIYIGSANMDWRSLTQVKELGVLITNCSCLAKDVQKVFNVYWDMGKENAAIPPSWPNDYSTNINSTNPISVEFNGNSKINTYLSSSPPPFSPVGRTQDIDAIVNVILSAEKFVHISVMDYLPLMIYGSKPRFWPVIDDALRKAAIDNRVSVKLLISYWKHSRPSEDFYLRSLADISNSYHNIDVQIRRFTVPATADQAQIPFGRVNHNKYMVTDKVAYIGTSNWSGDYFVNTAGVGLVLEDPASETGHNQSTRSIRTDLASVFERDWNSEYARDLF